MALAFKDGKKNISIPYGAIKSGNSDYTILDTFAFQFLMVRLKVK